MIKRYIRPEMGKVWDPKNRYSKWLRIELIACEAMFEEGLIPKEPYLHIKRKASFSVERITKIENVIDHDIIAFLTNLEEYVGPDSRFIHMGLTSSDVKDTGFALILREAMLLIIDGVTELMASLREKAF